MRLRRVEIASILLFGMVVSGAAADVVELEPDRDNTLYNEGDLSNALGIHVFAGRTAGGARVRRTLMRFDVAGAVPPGSTIDQVTLTMIVNRVALGTGISGDIAWKDIEILRDVNGAPLVSLSGETLDVANALGVTRWLLSISHTETYAVASAIAVTA